MKIVLMWRPVTCNFLSSRYIDATMSEFFSEVITVQ